MKQRIGSVSLLVRDYDEAIEYFSKMLDFRVVEDTAIECPFEMKRRNESRDEARGAPSPVVAHL